MTSSKVKNLTIFESAAIIAGTGIGSGVMAIPFLFKNAGIIGGMIGFALAFTVSLFMHFIVADAVINSETYEVTSLFNKLLLAGKRKKPLEITFFLLIVAMLVANLSAYILGGADVLVTITGIKPYFAKFIFYIFSILPVIFGAKAIGVGEKYLVVLIIGLVFFFSIISFFNGKESTALVGSVTAIINVFSMAMFSMTALFAVPEIAKGFNNDSKKIKKSISIGLIINLSISLFICFSVILSSKEVTEMAAVGWSKALGSNMSIFISIFVLLAMVTSFWVIALAFSNIVYAQFKISPKFCYLFATFPSLLVALIPSSSFSSSAKLASGAISVLIAILIVPAYLNSVKISGKSLILGNLGKNKLFLAAIILGNIFMIIGSLI